LINYKPPSSDRLRSSIDASRKVNSMKNTNAIITLLCLVALLCSHAAAQVGGADQLKHFSDKGLSFDYPSDASLEDKSGANGQHLVLVGGQGGAQIMLISRFETISSQEQFEKTRREMTDTLVNALLAEMKKNQAEPERADVQIDVAGARATGVRYRAVLGGEPGAMEIYTLLLGKRLVVLTLIGSDKEIAAAANAWAVVRRSLSVGPATTARAAARSAPAAFARAPFRPRKNGS
jgi:hypothetical protein